MERTRSAIAAVFPDRSSAHAAVDALEQQGFGRPWMAVTRPAASGEYGGDSYGAAAASQNEVAESSDGVFGAIGRFFSGEGNSLRRSLEDHGLSATEAEAIDTSMGPETAVLVVDGDERPDVARQIVQSAGGRLAGGTSYAASTSGAYDDAIGTTAATSAAMATARPATYDADTLPNAKATTGSTLDDETRRLQLREERLRIDKETVSAGEVTVGKRVETERTSVDVPVYHEEIFIERRPVTGATASGPIGTGSETITVPLTREEVRVDKTAVVREEVIVGKRSVEETRHVDETLRREELDTTGVTGVAGTSGLTGTTGTTGVSGTTGYTTGTTDAASSYSDTGTIGRSPVGENPI